MEDRFNFENLKVWNKSVEFCNCVISLTEKIAAHRRHFRLIEQLESAASSISSNIAEGTGRYSKKEFVHYLYISRGSLYETVNLLIIFTKRRWVEKEDLETLKNSGIEIGKMISSLIRAIQKQ